MPSLRHEALVSLFLNRPELGPELLRQALGVAVPEYTSATVESPALNQVTPTSYTADAVVVLRRGSKPVLGIVGEVQLTKDARKLFTWPVYGATVRADLECPTCILVVTPSADVAAWAARPIQLGPSWTLQPLVVGPESIPVVTDEQEARAAPELAVLSAVAHGGGNPETAVQVALAALRGCVDLEDERSVLYSDFVRSALSEAARVLLEEVMQIRDYEFQSEFARKHIALGKAEGKAEGETAARAQDIILVLEARGLPLSEQQRERILSSRDGKQLQDWLVRAATADTVDALFEVK